MYALRQSAFFKTYERKNLEFFIWCRESDFGYLYPSLIEKIGFSFLKKNRPHFQGTKVNFLFSFSLLELEKLNFYCFKMNQTIQVNIREYISINFTIK